MDEAIYWVGVLTAIHGILPIVYRLWYEKVTGRKAPAPAATPDVSASPNDFESAIHAADQPDPDDDKDGGDKDAAPKLDAMAPAGGDKPIYQTAAATKDTEDNAKRPSRRYPFRPDSDVVIDMYWLAFVLHACLHL